MSEIPIWAADDLGAGFTASRLLDPIVPSAPRAAQWRIIACPTSRRFPFGSFCLARLAETEPVHGGGLVAAGGHPRRRLAPPPRRSPPAVLGLPARPPAPPPLSPHLQTGRERGTGAEDRGWRGPERPGPEDRGPPEALEVGGASRGRERGGAGYPPSRVFTTPKSCWSCGKGLR